jgi:hypothetical protein
MSPSVGATLRARLNGRECQFDDGPFDVKLRFG